MKIIYSIFFSLTLACIVKAQSYSIYGSVTDTIGKPLANVNIVVIGTGFGASSNEKGEYLILDLSSGVYE